jgi:2-polyprenyl-3-methyl-5-hydroxy-6-metoxy-1,4-benzoquinol methylase
MTSSDNPIKKSPDVACIACDSPEVVARGRLPVFTPDFLGQALDDTVDAGTLYECKSCTLRFRFPQPGDDELMRYYQGMDVAECWQHGPEREVWRHVKQEMKSAPAPSVLDVGCFRGDLLSHLGNGFDRFGVEPSSEAAEEAQRRGITILSDSIDSLPTDGQRFGAITLIDVAEHLPRPLDSLQRLTRLLLPGGKLMIFTGNTAALSWRLAGVDYYYSAMPEHVAFMRPSWFQWAASRIGCEVSSITRMPYQPGTLRMRLDEGLKNLMYIGYRRLHRLAVVPRTLFKLPLLRRIGEWHGCWWTLAKDHVLVILTKIGESSSTA